MQGFPPKKRGFKRIVSWNVNGIRSCAKKGLLEHYQAARADVFSMQEVRALPEQIPEELMRLPRTRQHFFPAERKGYSGVGSILKGTELGARPLLLSPEFDSEGRLEEISMGDVVLINGYFPNGSGKNRDHSRVPYKLEFYEALRTHVMSLTDAGRPVVIYGDWNTAHRDIDLARPKTNRKTSGFLPVECAALDTWIESGFTDLFREEHGPAEGYYTWWSNRPGVRERNVGWRIDMFLSNSVFMDTYDFHVKHAPEVLGSDHCPIVLDLKQKSA